MSHLKAVPPGAKAPRRAPKTITEALEGSGRDVLASMRRALAQKLDAGEVSSNAIASAYKELRELDRLIRVMDAAVEEQGAGEDDRSEDESFDAASV